MLEQLTAIASVISALAIVATAVYASIQIRHNTRAVTRCIIPARRQFVR
jgi:hypothetical protein